MASDRNEPTERVSPWAEFAEARAVSARKYNDLRNRAGLAFRPAQQEAHESWESAMEEIEKEEKTDGS